MRTILLLSCFVLLGCGGEVAPAGRSAPPPTAPAPSATAPTSSSTAAPTSSAPAPASSTGANLLADEPTNPTEAPTASCEALARPCGGWVGCVHVRQLPRSGDRPARYEAIGIEAGAVYVLRQRCEDVCDEMCDPVSGTCRPGLVDEDEVDAVCTRSGPPTRAPFFCEMVEGACVRHDLPPPPPPGTRS
jgi:hypothetical protein